jgi:hypothetical protein
LPGVTACRHVLSQDSKALSRLLFIEYLLPHTACCVNSLQQLTLAQYDSLADVLDSELGYLAEQIARAPDNESAWNYLWGLFTLPGCAAADMGRQHKVRWSGCTAVLDRVLAVLLGWMAVWLQQLLDPNMLVC